jgi:hypothetical protein
MEETMAPSSSFYAMLAGNALLILTGVFWSLYWMLLYGPGNSRSAVPGGLLPLGTVLCGLAALIVLSVCVLALDSVNEQMPFRLWYIPAGGTIFFILWLALTTLAFKRVITSELFLIPLWAVLQFCVLYVLAGRGWLSGLQAAASTALTALAFSVGLVCYVLHYRLDEHGRFINGLVPYVAIGAVALAVDIMLLFNKIFRTGMIE